MKRHVRTTAAVLAVCLAFPAASALAQGTATTTTETTTTETTTEEEKPLFAFRDRLNFGGGAGVSLWDDFDDEGFAYRIQGWWEIIPWFAVEVEWLDPGQAEGGGIKGKVDGFNLSAMPRVPIGDFAIFGKVGCFFWDGDQELQGGGEQDLSFGAGMTYKLPNIPIGLRAEWTRVYMKDEINPAGPVTLFEIDEHADIVTIGAYFHW